MTTIKVYKEFDTNDMLELLENNLSSDLKNYDLAELILDFFSSCYEEIEEMTIRDFVRFEMQVQTLDEIKENYDYAIATDDDEEDLTDDDIEEFLNDNTTVLGSYEENGETFYVFSEF